MKRFKTYQKKKKKLITFFIFITIFTILFIIISLQKMKEDYSNLINYVLSDTVFNVNYDKKIFNTNLNNLIPTLSFMNKKELSNQTVIYLYQTNEEISEPLKNYLKELGIKVSLIQEDYMKKENEYLINIILADNWENIVINNMNYAKVSLISSEDEILVKKLNKYLNNNYLGLSRGIISGDKDNSKDYLTFEISKSDDSEALHNTLKVLAIMIKEVILST